MVLVVSWLREREKESEGEREGERKKNYFSPFSLSSPRPQQTLAGY